MDFYGVVEKRKSIRKYKSDPVEKEKLERIFQAARYAPSWKNLQCWRFMAIDDKETIAKVKANCDEWNQKIISDEVPLVVILFAVEADSGVRDGKDYYMLDAGLAMEHLMLAAANEGLGTCWMGLFDEEGIKQELGVPAGVRVIAISPLGYPNQDPAPRPRKELTEIVFGNEWGKPLF